MKSVDKLLSELRRLDVQLWAEGDRLRYRAPKGALSPDVLQALRDYKAELLTFLQAANAASQVSLVPIQRQGAKPPLFCIYGIFIYYELSRYLGNEQPVYGVYIQDEVDLLQEGHHSQQPQQPMSVVDLATRYLQEIRKQQPVGPYFLSGLSFGGLVAFEMAQQLRSQGEQVALLALFDTSEPGSRKNLSLLQRLSVHLQNYWQYGNAYLLDKVGRRLKLVRKMGLRLWQRMSSRMNPDLARATNVEDFLEQKVRFFHKASEAYQPKPYSGKIVLFRAMHEHRFKTTNPSKITWSQLAMDGLEVHEIPGDHLGILKDPNVELLSVKLTEAIDRALAARSLTQGELSRE